VEKIGALVMDAGLFRHHPFHYASVEYNTDARCSAYQNSLEVTVLAFRYPRFERVSSLERNGILLECFVALPFAIVATFQVSKEERQSARFQPFFNNFIGEILNSSDTTFPYKIPEQQVLCKVL
jgi:hypothetical protein